MTVTDTYKSTMKRQNKFLGILCMLLAPLSAAWQLIFYPTEECWYSVSASAHNPAADWIMKGLLFAAGVMFAAYTGYTHDKNGNKDNTDNKLTWWSAISCWLVVLFPCNALAAPDRVGAFQIPVEISHVIHCISAASLFISFAVMILWRFTIHDTRMTHQKWRRNVVYYTCGVMISVFMLVQVITSIAGIKFMTIITEFFMLNGFGIAWITKGEGFKFLNDK